MHRTSRSYLDDVSAAASKKIDQKGKKKHTMPNTSPHRSHRSRMLVLQYAEEEEEIHERHRSRKRINAIHKHSVSIIVKTPQDVGAKHWRSGKCEKSH
jgi:hypothetical protein